MGLGAVSDIYDMGTMGKGEAGDVEISVEQKFGSIILWFLCFI
ncbi:unnamed protein product [Onchocerca flexuosa]|uniref:Uncharacterized protein n=1 Tax=Onchocerca flexuosa TaxID=387005 RepID=A0A183HL99_9BILA|nr:unnamed protein product [Onchocerca flexuosa]